jgi:hypothetical protein
MDKDRIIAEGAAAGLFVGGFLSLWRKLFARNGHEPRLTVGIWELLEEVKGKSDQTYDLLLTMQDSLTRRIEQLDERAIQNSFRVNRLDERMSNLEIVRRGES